MLASCHAAHGVLFSVGLCFVVVTNAMSVHYRAQNVRAAESMYKLTITGTSAWSCAEGFALKAFIL